MHPSNSSDRFAISFAANHNPHISMWKYILFISVQPDSNSDESAILRRLKTFSNYNRFQTISMDIRIVGKDYDGVLGESSDSCVFNLRISRKECEITPICEMPPSFATLTFIDIHIFGIYAIVADGSNQYRSLIGRCKYSFILCHSSAVPNRKRFYS